MAAGATDRPMIPATAIRVSTYGRVWNRTGQAADSEAERSGSREASALEKPNRTQAAKAPKGRQPPKINAASAMKPRPAVMFSVNEFTKPIERKTPPIAASIPDSVTEA